MPPTLSVIPGPCPPWFCTLAQLSSELAINSIVMYTFWYSLAKLLFGTLWKNAGSLDDEFMVVMLRTVTVSLSLFANGLFIFMGFYPKYQLHVMCTGVDPRATGVRRSAS